MKYEYLLHTWGGFYNKEHQEKHGETSGYHYFDTEQPRDEYLAKLRKIEKELNANTLVVRESEGYNVRIITMLHRVVRWDDKEYYTEYKLGPDYPYEVAKYHLENEWYPGFNSYPFGDNFDYENNNIETIQEWITGAFDVNE